MELLKIVILSIIQGITEILPISSSGHLILFKYLFNIKSESLTLEIFLHLGSLIAVIIYYYKDLKVLLFDSFNYIFKKDKKNYQNNFFLLMKLIISTLVTGLFGLLLSTIIKYYLSSIKYLPIFFLFTALLLFITNKIKSQKSIDEISFKDSIIIGLFQLIGIIPGVSRSGITLIGCRTRKIDNDSSFKYSYLLFIPITFCSFILEIIDLNSGNASLEYPLYYYLIGILITFLFTYLSLKILLKIINRDKLHYFSYYLIFISLVTIITSLYL